MGDAACARRAAGACDILNHDRPTEKLADLLRKKSPNDIGWAARRVWHDQCYWSCRPVLGASSAAGDQGGCQDSFHPEAVHASLLSSSQKD
jgi:hypothetical protein